MILLCTLIFGTLDAGSAIRKPTLGSFEVMIETAYDSGGLPSEIVETTSLRLDHAMYKRYYAKDKCLITHFDEKTCIDESALTTDTVILTSINKNVPKELDNTKLGKPDKTKQRLRCGYMCLPITEKSSTSEDTIWVKKSEPTDMVAWFDYSHGKLSLSLVRVFKRVGTREDLALFQFRKGAHRVRALEDAILKQFEPFTPEPQLF